jgi:hypothetical protein
MIKLLKQNHPNFFFFLTTTNYTGLPNYIIMEKKENMYKCGRDKNWNVRINSDNQVIKQYLF